MAAGDFGEAGDVHGGHGGGEAGLGIIEACPMLEFLGELHAGFERYVMAEIAERGGGDGAGEGAQEAGEEAEQAGFAAAVGAGEMEGTAGGEGEGQGFEQQAVAA